MRTMQTGHSRSLLTAAALAMLAGGSLPPLGSPGNKYGPTQNAAPVEPERESRAKRRREKKKKEKA